MKLAELLEGLDVRRIDGDLNVEITGLSYDSRQTRPGDLFFSTARDATATAPTLKMHLTAERARWWCGDGMAEQRAPRLL